MKNVIHRPGQIDKVCDVMFDKLKLGITGQVGDIIGIAGQQIIENDDPVTFGEQSVTEMRPQKTRAPGHN